jgi:hypothetical protein
MDIDDRRSIAAAAYNRCWELLENEERSVEDDDELLTSAFTSRYHWAVVGGREQVIISDWMVSRAAQALGEADLALRFARRANDAAQEPATSDWLVASTAEGMARAFAVAGDEAQCQAWCEKAEQLIERIADDEDREIIAEQLATVPRGS